MKNYNSKEFRNELMKIMPGYKWTIHRSFVSGEYITATGIQTSGFNRTSTLQVTKSGKGSSLYYKVRSSGYGKRALWLGEETGPTLAQALRRLQDYYKAKANQFEIYAWDLEHARKKQEGGE